MSQLILQTGSGQMRAFPLRPGVNYIGCKPGNQIQIPHESVSGVHAQIEVEGERAVIRDRDSANGTQVNGQMILEAELAHGDCVTLGTVNLTFEEGVTAGATSAEAPAVVQAHLVEESQAMFVGETYCRNHPHNLVHYHCPRCQKQFCDLCVSARPEGGVMKHFCRACGNVCSTVRSGLQVKEPERFGKLLGGAFIYPFKGNGPVLLVTGTLFLILISVTLFFVRFAFLLGMMAMVITVLLGGGYLFSYIKGVVLTSATGSDTMPDWPDFTEWANDVIIPFFQVVGLFAVCLGPAWVLLAFTGGEEGSPMWIGAAALSLLGMIYLPMALLGISMFDSLIGLNPALVVPSIFKVAGHYALALLVVMGAALLASGSKLLIKSLLPIPIVPSVIGQAIAFYSLVVEARVLGVLYRANENRLGWFQHRNQR